MKKLLLALASTLAVLSFLPGSASAEVWHLEPSSKVTVNGGEVKLRTAVGFPVVCTSITGSGSYVTNTWGSMTLTLHGCTAGITKCTSKGEPTGTITTSSLPFDNILLEANPQTPGLMFTPTTVDNAPGAGEGFFVEFTCGISTTTTVRGNGLVGDITGPKCGESSKTLTVEFASAAAGIQKWMQVTTTGTKYDLTAQTTGGAWTTASLEAVLTINLEKEGKMNCTP